MKRMKRILSYILIQLAIIAKIFSQKLYMRLIVKAHKINGAKIMGMPAFIDKTAYIDTSGGLTIDEGVVISWNAIVLTHDWSFLRRYLARDVIMPPPIFLINRDLVKCI